MVGEQTVYINDELAHRVNCALSALKHMEHNEAAESTHNDFVEALYAQCAHEFIPGTGGWSCRRCHLPPPPTPIIFTWRQDYSPETWGGLVVSDEHQGKNPSEP